MSIKICTFNVKCLNDPFKRKQIFHWLKINKYSICLLQELHCTAQAYGKWSNEWGDDIVLSGNHCKNTGVGMFINGKFSNSIQEYINIIDGRMQSLKLSINDKDYVFLKFNVYAPKKIKSSDNF